MKPTTNNNQAGVVLLVVLLTLELLGIVGLSFVYYAAAPSCDQNPTREVRDGRCVHNVGSDR